MSTKQKPDLKVGVIGLGLMGSAFASNLLARGYEVHVYNRTSQKAEPLVARGAVLHPTARDLAPNVDVVMTSLTDQNAIESVALGDEGFLGSMRKGALWVDVSTIDPAASVRHAQAANDAGVERLDAPVIGSVNSASKGELIILVGGRSETFQRYQGFLKELSKTVVYLGVDGNGHRMKLDVNLYLGLMGQAFSEALVLARKQGFDAKTFVDLINQTPHRNSLSQTKGPKIAAGDFTAAFSLNNLLKDLRLADGQARATGATLPMTKVALAQYAKAAEQGRGDEDYSVIALVLEEANGLTS